jgi:hypothetical protein
MSTKTYKSNSWNPVYNQTKTTPKTNNSFPLQAKNENELDTNNNLEHNNSEYKVFPNGGMIENTQRSFKSGNVPLSSPPIQPKLTIGAPRDRYEQEADQVAAQVVQRINTPSPPSSNSQDNNDSIQRKPLISVLQRVQDTEQNTPIPLQAKFNFKAPDIQADFESNLNSAKSGGSPLDKAFRAKIEPEMGADFSGVRVHNDATANHLSRSIQAKAFTTGTHIFMKQGEYNPSSRGGQELLAHELTHVVQQNGSAVQRHEDHDVMNHTNETRSPTS